MEKNKARKIGLKSVVLCLLIVVLFLGMLGGIQGKTAKAETSSKDVEISSGDTITNYYMTIPLKGVECEMDSKDFMSSKWGEFKAWDRQDKNVTFIFRFKDILYADKNTKEEMGILVTTTASVNLPGSRTTGFKLVFNNDLVINIRETYYNYLKFKTEKGEGNYNRFNTTLYWNGKGIILRKGASNWGNDRVKNLVFDLDVKLDTKEKPPTSNNPEDPDFELGDNNGTTPKEKDNFSIDKFFKWFLSIWGSTKPLDIFAQIAFVIIGIAVIVLVFKFIKWAFK